MYNLLKYLIIIFGTDYIMLMWITLHINKIPREG